MTRTKSTYLAIVAVLLSPMAANADLISTDWNASGDGLLTLDTATGLEWLDFTETYDMGLATAASLLSSTFSDFRFATHLEVLGLMNNAGLPTPAFPHNGTVATDSAIIASQNAFTDLISETVGRGFGARYYGSRGMVNELNAIVGSYLIDGSILWVDNTCCTGGNRGAGVWLVRDATAVPEPGTLALLGIGLAGMGLMRRRKKA